MSNAGRHEEMQLSESWQQFAAYSDVASVPSVEWAREIFRSLERSRTVIMHSGQLKMGDVERVAMNIRDWLRQVGG